MSLVHSLLAYLPQDVLSISDQVSFLLLSPPLPIGQVTENQCKPNTSILILELKLFSDLEPVFRIYLK